MKPKSDGSLEKLAEKAATTDKEWDAFVAAIQKEQSALKTFTKQALMLIYLTLGKEGLK